jgi:hypothetical protein
MIHFAKKKMRSDSDILLTYEIKSEETLKSIKRGIRLSKILGSESLPTKLESDVISILKKYIPLYQKEINKIISSKDLKRFVINNKRKLIINMTSLDEFKKILKIHNFRDHGSGISDGKIHMFKLAKVFNKS